MRKKKSEASLPELTPAPACRPHLQGTVVLGLSGGRDSVALLHLLRQQGCCVQACHVHHGIRGEAADADAAFCRALCERLGVGYTQHNIDVPALAASSKMSLELVARMARQDLLKQTARAHHTHTIALAHHANDQAETVLFRLARGAAGHRGMREVQEFDDFLWIRPLLQTTRSEITQWLQEHGETWVEDATNSVPDVTRNRLRLEVLPALNHAMGRDVTPILNRSARLQDETLTALDEALGALSLTDPQGRLYLPALDGHSEAFCKAALHRYLKLANIPDLTEQHIVDVLSILDANAAGHSVNLCGGYQARRQHKRLCIYYLGELQPVLNW